MKRTKNQYLAPVMREIPFWMEGYPLMTSVTPPDIVEEPIGWAPIFSSESIL